MSRKVPGGAPLSAARKCTKVYHRDQAAARIALRHITAKAKPGAKRPTGVYPCDVCDGWHLTSKKRRGKPPGWDLHPDWSRRAT